MPQPPNLQNMLRQAQEMMAAQQQAQEALKSERVEASAGGGMVKVTMSGDLELKSLAIDPDAVDPEDVEMLQDMVMAAINEALRQAMELQSKLTGAGGMDMGAMMKQVQKMQADMLKAQEELKDEVVEASAGGGMIKVTMSGDLELRSVEIDPDAVDPEDVEMLQDMVMAAINEALRAAQEAANNKMGGVTGGLGGGGGLGGLGLPGM